MRHFIFDLGIFFLFIYFSGKEFKDYRNGGYFHFWQGISIGFIVIIPAVLLFSIAFYITFQKNPELLTAYQEGTKALLDPNKEIYLEKYSEQQYEQITAVDDETTVRLLFSTFWKKIIAGFLITPVVAIILRKNLNRILWKNQLNQQLKVFQ